MDVTEKVNRKLVEIARSMIVDCVILNMWWWHVVIYETKISNNSCYARIFRNKDTKYGNHFNKDPDIKLLKLLLGWTDYIYITFEKRTKLDVKSGRGSLVVVAEDMMCYKVHFGATKRTIQAGDMTFIYEPDEKIFLNDVSPQTLESHYRSTQPTPSVTTNRLRGMRWRRP